MSHAIAFVVTPGRVYWHMTTDVHADIIRMRELNPDDVVCTTVTPTVDGFDYVCITKTLPKWANPVEVEARTRRARRETINARIFFDGNHHVNRGVFWAFGGKVTATGNALVYKSDKAEVETSENARVVDMRESAD